VSATTTGLLAVGPAVFTGILGYAIARLQAKATGVQANAETERLRRQHDEAARQRRQAAYHDLLALMYALDSLLAGMGPDPFSKAALDAWLGRFQLLYGAIDLFGTDTVRSEILGVKRELDAMGTAARHRAGSTRSSGFADDFVRAYADGRTKLISAVNRMIDAMRTDVWSAPGSGDR
jgi:hypothetical protein